MANEPKDPTNIEAHLGNVCFGWKESRKDEDEAGSQENKNPFSSRSQTFFSSDPES